MPTPRAYTTGAFALEIDGVACGFAQSVEGGAIWADVLEERLQPDGFAKKHLGPVRYDDLVVRLGVPAQGPLLDWMVRSWRHESPRRNGAIVFTDQQLRARARREFRNALLSEVTLPACDGGSKEPAYITLRLAPEQIRTEPASGKVSGGSVTQKQWLPSNFRLSIDGLDCSRVARIDALTVRQKTVEDPVGAARDYARVPGKIEFPNLRITVSEATAQSWMDWHEDFVVLGNCGDDREKTGTLEYLAANRKDVLLSVRFRHLGIFRLADEPGGANGNRVKRIVCELYCERMELAPWVPRARAVRSPVTPSVRRRISRPPTEVRPGL